MGLFDFGRKAREERERQAAEEAKRERAANEEKKRREEEARKRTMSSGIVGSFRYITLPDGTLKITEYLEVPGYEEIEFPAELDGRKVTAIGDGVLCRRGALNYGVSVAEGITSIGDMAFGDPKLLEVYLPNSISKVTGNPFYIPAQGSLSSNRVHFSSNHPYLFMNDDFIFGKADKRVICYFARKQAEVTVPEGIEIIGKHAINSDNLTKVILPDSVNTIEESGVSGAFLTSIRLPKQLRYIGKWAFPARAVNSSFIVPASVQHIEPAAFTRMHIELESSNGNYFIKNGLLIEKDSGRLLCMAEPNLKEILVPDSVKIIGKGAFSFSSITSISMPDSVVVIEDEAFRSASQLEKIRVSSNLKQIGHRAFDDCGKLRISIPESVVSIGTDAFSGYKRISLLIVTPNSYAEAYAKEWRIPYSIDSADEDPMSWLNSSSPRNNSGYNDLDGD